LEKEILKLQCDILLKAGLLKKEYWNLLHEGKYPA
jgi:hypothetical protein